MASPGSLTAAAIAEGAKVFQGLIVPVGNIHIDPGFNVRISGEELTAHIRWLADQIKQNGFDHTQPLAVIRHPDISGHVIVRKGHCRFNATLLANEEGKNIIALPVLVEPRGTNEVLQTYQLGTSNSGLHLNYLEYAVAVMRQRGYGETDEQIIAGFKKDRSWLNRVLDLNEAPVEVRRMVTSGRVADTEAVKEVRRSGREAVPHLTAAVEHAEARGKRKATRRDIEAVADKPRTAPPSLCSLATAFLLAWDAWERDDGPELSDVRLAVEAMRVCVGPALIEARRVKEAA